MVVLLAQRLFVTARCLLVALVAGRVRDAAMLEAMQIEAILFGDDTRFDRGPHKILKGVIEAGLR